MLFKGVNDSEYFRVLAEKAQRFDLLDGGIHAVEQAAAKVRAIGIAAPDPLPQPGPNEFAAMKERDGDALATRLLEGLAVVEQRKKELEEQRDRAIGADLVLYQRRRLQQEQTKRVAKVGAWLAVLMILFLALKSCAS